mgnify:FL=1
MDLLAAFKEQGNGPEATSDADSTSSAVDGMTPSSNFRMQNGLSTPCGPNQNPFYLGQDFGAPCSSAPSSPSTDTATISALTYDSLRGESNGVVAPDEATDSSPSPTLPSSLSRDDEEVPESTPSQEGVLRGSNGSRDSSDVRHLRGGSVLVGVQEEWEEEDDLSHTNHHPLMM